MFLMSRLRRRWQHIREERARGEESRRRVFESLKTNERKRIDEIKRIEVQKSAEEHRQKVQEQAYLLWEADGKQEGRDEHYWRLAVDKVKGKNVAILYKSYYLLEKCILEPMDAWISRQAFFTILGGLGNLAIVIGIITFVFGENVRRNNEVFAAWQTITSANGQSGSGGRIEALQFLNSRPLKFPWIGWTKKGWYWDKREEECKERRLWGLRWKRQSLIGLSTPKAYLGQIHLCNATLHNVNFQEAVLSDVNLQESDLRYANLKETNLSKANLQKVILWSANLQAASLEEVKFQDAELEASNLQDANLARANLQSAGLTWANLQGAQLYEANLQGAGLYQVNLQDSFLVSANLQGAQLYEANLQGAWLEDVQNYTHEQIKSACYWDKAIYKGFYLKTEDSIISIEPDNKEFIEELKNDTASDPEYPPNCSYWEKSN